MGTGDPLRKGLLRLRAAAVAAVGCVSRCHLLFRWPAVKSQLCLQQLGTAPVPPKARPGLCWSVALPQALGLGTCLASCLPDSLFGALCLPACLPEFPNAAFPRVPPATRLRLAPRKTGPTRRCWELAGRGHSGGNAVCPQEGGGAAPAPAEATGTELQACPHALIWRGRYPGAAVHWPQVWRQACCIQGPLEYTAMCRLPSKLFPACMESPLKHKCQVRVVTKGPVLGIGPCAAQRECGIPPGRGSPDREAVGLTLTTGLWCVPSAHLPTLPSSHLGHSEGSLCAV